MYTRIDSSCGLIINIILKLDYNVILYIELLSWQETSLFWEISYSKTESELSSDTTPYTHLPNLGLC